jgi:predicted transcriptional regulator
MTDEEVKAIAELHKSGHSHSEMAQMTGRGYTTIVRAVKSARRLGYLPPRKVKSSPRKKIQDVYANQLIKLGYINNILVALTPEQQDWLATEIHKTKCESVAEYLTELVRDAHAEEKANK